MIRKPFWIGLILVLCCFLLFVILPSPGGQVAAAPIEATPTSAPPSTRSLGLPAIHATLLAPSNSSASRFTIADAQAYLQNHPFFGGQIVQGATMSIVTVQFMTSQQASALIHGEETGLPATAMVCYAKLHGPFTQNGAPVAPGAQELPAVDYGVEIFDAQTGNLLMWWTPSA